MAQDRREYLRDYYQRNKDKARKAQRESKRLNPEAWREYNRRYRERNADQITARRYGISVRELRELKQAANGRCQICGDERRRLFVDHDHTTGQVRGLLCSPCNGAIGFFEENETRMYSAMAYLRRAKEAGRRTA